MKTVLSIAIAAALTAAIAAPAVAEESGHDAFISNCSACHQPTGKGIQGAFPALAGNAFVQGDGAKVASVVLNGRGGMPTFKGDLSDAQIAAILTYVRSAWGNHAPAIATATVAAVRAAGGAAKPQGLQAH